jgi:hypothetical protein
MILHCVVNFRDYNGHKGISEFNFFGDNFNTAAALAHDMTAALAQYSQCRVDSISIFFGPDVSDFDQSPSGNILRQLLIFCQTGIDPATNRRWIYKIRVIDPMSTILNLDETRFDPSLPASLALISDFLSGTTDQRGLPFESVVHGEVVQFLGGI